MEECPEPLKRSGAEIRSPVRPPLSLRFLNLKKAAAGRSKRRREAGGWSGVPAGSSAGACRVPRGTAGQLGPAAGLPRAQARAIFRSVGTGTLWKNELGKGLEMNGQRAAEDPKEKRLGKPAAEGWRAGQKKADSSSFILPPCHSCWSSSM